MGNDIVTDFSRAEGDRIVIEGHTTQIAEITYGDANGDGVMDHSIIEIYSDQGSGGGAHNDDRLGTITVYGDLIKESDIEHSASPAYGIVTTIEDLDDALKPTDNGENKVSGFKAKDFPDAGDFISLSGAAPKFLVAGTHHYSSDKDSAMGFGNVAHLQMATLTVAFTFRTDTLDMGQALFSKDASGNGKGHTSVWINEEGDLIVRLQTKDGSDYLVAESAVEVGESYDFALSLGGKGAQLFVNGVKVAYDSTYTHNWSQNEEGIVVGGTGWASESGAIDVIHARFQGKITDFAVYDKQLSDSDIAGSVPRAGFAYFEQDAGTYTFENGDGTLEVSGDAVRSKIQNLAFNNVTVAVDDVQIGAGGDDELRGGEAADILVGRAGNDLLDGRGNDDHSWGGAGEDQLYGGGGVDWLSGGADDDYLSGGNDADFLFGDSGNDELKGDEGADHFYGGVGDDYYYGNSWGDAGTSAGDSVYFMGNFANYTFETSSFFHTSRGVSVDRLVVTDKASGGSDQGNRMNAKRR
jgi:Ca2+-binding RTX toxin-like protein